MAKRSKTTTETAGSRTIATNRKARFEYDIEETVEAGIVLTGSEIKSVRAGKVSLQEAYAVFEGGEPWLVGAHIASYPFAGYADHEPTRRRKLLLHRKQIERLAMATKAKGFTLVPLRLYLQSGLAKVEIGLARGRRDHDKRQAIKERESKRAVEREISRRTK